MLINFGDPVWMEDPGYLQARGAFLGSGADIGQQYIRAGLVDEISIHLVPVLFGSGTRLFEHIGSEPIQLETTEVIETTAAMHLRFRAVK
jgi:dihydrofolate reductase